MIILGIETSCDETSSSLIKILPDQSIEILSYVISSSQSLHAKTGGIIPEVAAREQLKYIIPVIEQALQEANLYNKSLKPDQRFSGPNIDALAVTHGPGLIGSLLVGVETAKTLAYMWNKPIIPVNHLYGHIYANWIKANDQQQMTKDQIPKIIRFPALALVVSGGHTDLVLMRDHGDLTVIGGTRDDAAGEAFDKIGRILNLSYPAGPVIAKLAEKGDSIAFQLPRPMHDSGDFDFSFSGLKTSVLNLNKKNKWNFSDIKFRKKNSQLLADISASVQAAIVDVLVAKTLAAARKYAVKSIILGGGVAANEKLQSSLIQKANNQLPITGVFVPQKFLCTDNAAMIATAAAFNYNPIPWQKLSADPELYFP